MVTIHKNFMWRGLIFLSSLLFVCQMAIGQTITREFPYAGTTYRYQLKPVQDSSAYRLHIQALKSRKEGITIHRGRVSSAFSHPRRWRITIYASQKKKSGWTTRQDSYLEISFDRQRQSIAYFDEGALVDIAEPKPIENFAGEWEQLNRTVAFTTAIEYYIMNYTRALGQHDVEVELETEESLMLEQMMATRQAQRDSLVAAISEQRQQQANPISDTLQTAVALADSAASAPAPIQTTNLSDSVALASADATNILTDSSSTLTVHLPTTNPSDSLTMALASADTLMALADSAAALAALPKAIRLEGEFELPFISQLPVDDKIFFIEARHDETYPGRIELKLRRYDADSNRTELVYVSYMRIKDSASVSGKYDVLIHLAENNGYEWKTYPNSFLECSLNTTGYKMCYRVVGSRLASRLQDPAYAQREEELPTEITELEKQDVLLSAARYFIKSCTKALLAN